MHCRPFHRILLSFFIVLTTFSCQETKNDTDLEEIRQQLKEHEMEIQALKLAVERINQDISSIRAILSEISAGGYVTSVAVDSQDEVIAGYTLSFTDGRGVYLRTSTDSDNPAPSVSVKKNADGCYYWTLNGDWLLNAEGGLIPASDDSSYPLLRSEEAGWSVSVDGGFSWMAAPSSAQGSSMFSSIDTSNPDYVLITLTDGTVLQLPTWSAFVALRNMVNHLNTNLASLQVIVSALQDGDYLLGVSPYIENGEQAGWILNFSKSGIVIIYSGKDGKDGATPSFKIEDGWWYISYDNGASWTKMDRATSNGDGVVIDGVDFSDESFVTLILSDGTHIFIPRFRPSDFVLDVPEEGFPIQAGETISIHFSISGSAPEKIVVTAASDGFYRPRIVMNSATDGMIYVTAPSPYVDGYIIVMLDDGNGYNTMRTVKFCQRYIDLPEGIIIDVEESGGTITIPWYGNYSFTVSTDSDWIHPVSTKATFSGQIKLDIEPNHSDVPRAGILCLHPDDNPSFTSQEIYIREGAEQAEVFGPASMVLTVRASYANSFTVYLPFKGSLNCTVDWGDGQNDSYSTYMERGDWISHNYNVSEPSTFVVTVTGKVQYLNATDIPQKSGIESIIHWGNLETENADSGFLQITSLRSVAADTDGFFSKVTNCNHLFEACSGLNELPGGLFRSGAGITSFESTFSDCVGLSSLPASLFEGCSSAFFLANTFFNCVNLSSIPEDLLWFFPKAKNLTGFFVGCGLTSLHSGLFAKCPDVESISSIFAECSSLTGIPSELFDNNRKIIDFSYTFRDCRNLSGETPYTVIDGKKVHLYERKDYPDYFVAPVYYDKCFPSSNGGLSDYEAISAAGWN